MRLTWPKYFANKPILTASLTGIAIAAVGLAWVVVLMAVLYGLDQIFPSGGGAGFSLLDGFVIAPIVFIAGLPWSLEADLGGANTAWTIGVMVALSTERLAGGVCDRRRQIAGIEETAFIALNAGQRRVTCG